MLALSIKQPYLDQIISGVKKFEFRNWKTNYRGPVVLCSSKAPISKDYKHLPLGVALCLVDLEDISDNDIENNAYRYKWHLKNIRKIKPFAVKGQLNLFKLSRKLTIL